MKWGLESLSANPKFDLAETALSGAVLRDQEFPRAFLVQTEKRDLTFLGVKFSLSHFLGAKLLGPRVLHTQFERAEFTCTELRGGFFFETDFVECAFKQTVFVDCIFDACRFSDSLPEVETADQLTFRRCLFLRTDREALASLEKAGCVDVDCLFLGEEKEKEAAVAPVKASERPTAPSAKPVAAEKGRFAHLEE